MSRHPIRIPAALALLICLAGKAVPASAQELTVAVAASFAPAMEHIIRQYTAETGIPVRMTVSSTGRLYAQIQNKAPYDLFYAADVLRPDLLFAEGLCSEPSRYATGEAVLWSGSKDICSLAGWQEVVTDSRVKKIAIANPETAPYGNVARATIEMQHLAAMQSKLVYGSNVGQSFQYAAMGTVDAAFVALSLALSEKGNAGCHWRMTEAPKVEQKACVTNYGRKVEEANRFLEFTLSDNVALVREKFGYGL